MTNIPKITLNNVSYFEDHFPVRFNELNLSFEKVKYGVVGQNGVGKTTLLRLLLNELTPTSGSIQRTGQILNVPQNHASIEENASVSDVLAVSPILEALNRIKNGSVSESDFEITAEQWDIESRLQDALKHFSLWPIDLQKPFHQLSGGQKTNVLLAKTLIFPADFFIFDEPTNNLDRESRQILYQYVTDSKQGMIIVSHDRMLLNQCEKIVEITTKGIEVYGGDYDFYEKQKSLKIQALNQEIQARTEILTKAKQTVQTRMERHQQNEAKGRKGKIAQIKAKNSYDKIEMNSKKGQSEKTNRRIRLQVSRKLDAISEELMEARSQLEIAEKLDVCLSSTAVPNAKTVLKIENLCFSYLNNAPLIHDFNLHLIGPARIAIEGPNGSGKSTLIKLIRGLLIPDTGTITLGINAIAYLDQTVSFLNPDETIVENFLRLNLEANPFDAYSALASFKFRNVDAEKIVKNLSGGERMRAGLAVSLMSTPAPQLIILDEPTNHLDLDAIKAIEMALQQYQGVVLAVSHDTVFLDNINININERIKINPA